MRRHPRPWRDRIWFWKPEWHWHGWKTLVPFFRGGDEYDWHTICLGWTITGRVIIATRRCPGTGRCAEEAEYFGLTDWPRSFYDDTPPASSPVPETDNPGGTP